MTRMLIIPGSVLIPSSRISEQYTNSSNYVGNWLVKCTNGYWKSKALVSSQNIGNLQNLLGLVPFSSRSQEYRHESHGLVLILFLFCLSKSLSLRFVHLLNFMMFLFWSSCKVRNFHLAHMDHWPKLYRTWVCARLTLRSAPHRH